MLKRFAILVSALALFVLQSQSAFACGGLVAPNGAIRLSRATTLVAWHNGIEHYMTSFTYQGDVSNLGWIVPLPAVPIKIEEGGAWTLQRLFRETHPEPVSFLNQDTAASASAVVEVLQQVKVEPLNITRLRGGNVKVAQYAVGRQVPGAPGLQLACQEHVNPALFHDLSTDRNMSWVRQDSWLSYLSLDAPNTAVTYDLGISSSGVIRIAPFG